MKAKLTRGHKNHNGPPAGPGGTKPRLGPTLLLGTPREPRGGEQPGGPPQKRWDLLAAGKERHVRQREWRGQGQQPGSQGAAGSWSQPGKAGMAGEGDWVPPPEMKDSEPARGGRGNDRPRAGECGQVVAEPLARGPLPEAE